MDYKIPANDDITPTTFPKYSPDPLIASLPPHLKDPANYQKIKKAILETLATKCSHSDMLEMAECPKCTQMMITRRKFLKDLGFISPAQYLNWQKVNEEIIRRYPLVDWEAENKVKKVK